MEHLVQQIVDGLASGSIYASLALALVLVFRSTGVVNFAQGEMAVFSTYIAWQLEQAGLAIWAAIAITLAISLAIGAVVERAVVRPLEGTSPQAVIIVTFGLLLLFNSLAGWIWTYRLRAFPPPFSDRIFRLGGVRLSLQSVGTVAVLIGVVLVLTAVFRFTRLGLALRAVASNPESSRLAGVRVGPMLMTGWALAASLGALSGVLVAPKLFLDPNMMAGVLVYAFAAATLGGLDSPVGAVVGGLVIGVGENLVGTYVHVIRADLKVVAALALIFLVLLLRPQGLFGSRSMLVVPDATPAPQERARPTTTRRLVIVRNSPFHWFLMASGIGGLALAALLLPFGLKGYQLFRLTLVLVFAIAVLGLNLLVRSGGQISLGHSAFFAVGAYAAAILAQRLHWPFLLAIPAACAVTFVVGFLFGLPALRLKGPYLTLVTLGLAVAIGPLIKRFGSFTGGTLGVRVHKSPAPSWLKLNLDQWLYFVSLGALVVSVVVARNLLQGRFGRAMAAVRDHEVAAQSLGIHLALVKTATFATSAALAGLAGAVFAFVEGYIAPETFPLALSVTLLAGVVVGGSGTVIGPLCGAVFIQNVPVYAARVNPALAGVIYGVALVVFMILGGAVGLGRRLRDLLVSVQSTPAPPLPPRRARNRREPALVLEP